MKTRVLTVMTSLAVCGLSVAGVAWQSRQLGALRDDGRRLRQQLEELNEEKEKPATLPATAQPAIGSPSAELLRLRNQVSQLARRERELAGVQTENQRLQTQVAAAQTNKAQSLPPSYIRKSEARYLGYATPEATIETFLWAVQNKDLNTMLACYTPDAASELRRKLEKSGDSPEQLFKGAEGLPGINVLARVQKSDDLMEYKVEMVPGSGEDGPAMPFRRISGEWKMGPPR